MAKIQRTSCWWMQNNYNAPFDVYNAPFMKKIFGFKWFRFFQLIQDLFFHRLHNELRIFSLFPVICFVSWRPCPWGSYISWPHGSQRVPLRAQITKNRVRSDPTLLTFGEYLNMNVSLGLENSVVISVYPYQFHIQCTFQNTVLIQHHHTLRTYSVPALRIFLPTSEFELNCALPKCSKPYGTFPYVSWLPKCAAMA